MKITVLLFAAAREAAGQGFVLVNIEDADNEITTVRRVREYLLNEIPSLQRIASALLWAVNNEYAAEERTVREGDVVACFPPVSGG
jgi:molybdopterin converting factor subunit 1